MFDLERIYENEMKKCYLFVILTNQYMFLLKTMLV